MDVLETQNSNLPFVIMQHPHNKYKASNYILYEALPLKKLTLIKVIQKRIFLHSDGAGANDKGS